MLEKILKHDAIEGIHTFFGSGLPDDPLAGYYFTTLIMKLPNSQEKILCCGTDKDESISKIKAAMEFCERYVFKTGPKEFAANNSGKIADFSKFFSLLDKEISTKIQDNFFDPLVSGFDYFSGEKILLPVKYIFSGAQQFPFKISSNGFAAHTSRESAIESGLFELIERDAMMRWWMNPQSAKLITVPEKFQARINAINKNIPGATTNLLLLNSPLDVPVVLALLYIADGVPTNVLPMMLSGSGSNYSMEVATEKALNELSGAVLNVIVERHKGEKQNIDFEKLNFDNPTDHVILYEKGGASLDFLHFNPFVPSDFHNQPSNLTQKLKSLNLNCYIFESSEFLDCGAYVVSVIVPGLFPLLWSKRVPFDSSQFSKISLAQKLPHCFG